MRRLLKYLDCWNELKQTYTRIQLLREFLKHLDGTWHLGFELIGLAIQYKVYRWQNVSLVKIIQI